MDQLETRYFITTCIPFCIVWFNLKSCSRHTPKCSEVRVVVRVLNFQCEIEVIRTQDCASELQMYSALPKSRSPRKRRLEYQ